MDVCSRDITPLPRLIKLIIRARVMIHKLLTLVIAYPESDKSIRLMQYDLVGYDSRVLLVPSLSWSKRQTNPLKSFSPLANLY